MHSCFHAVSGDDTIPITPVASDALDAWLAEQPSELGAWVKASGFTAGAHSFCLVPTRTGQIERVLVGQSAQALWTLASLPMNLPDNNYCLDCDWSNSDKTQALIGWGLGAYQFTTYKSAERTPARLAMPAGCDADEVDRQVAAATLARDLVNTPAEDMMPAQLSAAIEKLAARYSAEVSVIEGDELLAQNYPAIHAVGRASVHSPRLIDLRWGNVADPKVTVVGKGVCFDSGGLDLKPSKGMRFMKKDMGGAAQAIAVCSLIMDAKLPVRLRLLIPAVENAVSGNAYRPGDILSTRAGLSVEIDNTDAEGRVILCDALFEAAGESPQLLIDFATLTGAARVALGTELPAMFCNDDDMARGISEACVEAGDAVWRMPLHADYRDMVQSKFADLVNSPSNPYGGAITAALFLQAFVPAKICWAHFDVMAWNVRSRPGRPEGGEAMGVRAVYGFLHDKFG